MIFVYTTCSSKKEAKDIAKALIKEKLASCGNYFPCGSVYHWKEDQEEASEYILLMKTEESLYSEVKDKINEMHSYELPVIAKIPVEFSEEYAEWMDRQLK